jgi:hypothetical protein
MILVPGLVLHWEAAAQSIRLRQAEKSLQEDTRDFHSASDSFGMKEIVLAAVLGGLKA